MDKKPEALRLAEPIYQISLVNGPTKGAWIDVDEADYFAARMYGEYRVRKLYTAPHIDGENNE